MNGKITQEELKQIEEEQKAKAKAQNVDRQKVLQGLREGKSDKEIAETVSFGATRVSKVRKELIEEGEITKEEIDEARNKRISEEKKQDKDSLRVLRGLKEGETRVEILRDVSFGEARLKKVIAELKKDGEITQDEIDKARSERKLKNEKHENKIEENQEVSKEQKNWELQLLLIGLRTQTIRNIMGISNSTYTIIKKALIIEGKITEEQIKEAQNRYSRESTEITYSLLKQGYSVKEIEEQIKYGQVSGIVKDIILKLKQEGRISTEEIAQAKFERNEKDVMQYILTGLKNGLTHAEMIEKNKAIKLNSQVISQRTRRLIANGDITKEEIERKRKERRDREGKERRKNYVGPHDERILKLCDLGFTTTQIANIIEVDSTYVSIRKRAFIEGEVRTSEDFDYAIKHLSDITDERRNKITSMAGYEIGIDIQIVKDHIEYIRAKKDLGEIEKEDMNCMRKIVPMDHDLLTLRNINFVVDYLRGEDKLKQAIDFINECLDSANDYEEKKWQEVMKLKSVLEQELEKKKQMKASRKARGKSMSEWKHGLRVDVSGVAGVNMQAQPREEMEKEQEK